MAMCDHSWLYALLARSLVKLPIVGMDPRARRVINQDRVTDRARQIPGTQTTDPLDGKKMVDPLDQ